MTEGPILNVVLKSKCHKIELAQKVNVERENIVMLLMLLRLHKRIKLVSNDEERIKLELEYLKAVGTIIPIFIAIVAIFLNMYLQAKRSNTDFQLKAAEIIFNNQDARDGIYKARVLNELFPDYIPREKFDEKLKKIYKLPNLSD